MALFDFKCRDCGEVSEYLLFSSSETPVCAKCGSGNIEKMLSSFAVSAKSSSSPKETAPSCPYSGRCGGGMCGM